MSDKDKLPLEKADNETDPEQKVDPEFAETDFDADDLMNDLAEVAKAQETARENATDIVEIEPDPKAKKKNSLAARILALVPGIGIAFLTAYTVYRYSGPGHYVWQEKHTTYFAIMIALLTLSVFVGSLRPRIPKAVGWVLWTLAPAGTMLLCEWIIRDPFNGKMTTEVILLNIAFYYIAALILLFLTRNTWISVIGIGVLPLIIAIANHYVILFRGNALFPWDLQSIGIAMTVAGNYQFDFPFQMALVIAAFVVIWQVSYFARAKIFRSVKKMIVSFVLCLISCAMMFSYAGYMRTDRVVKDFKLYPYMFTPTTVYYRDGMAVSLLFSLKFLSVDKPEGYSTEEIERMMAQYESASAEQDTPADTKDKPNIIVIMNEAWSDLSVLGDFPTSLPYNPVTAKLTEDTVKGHMYVSVVGGNTANTEFEFLTGSTMAFLPPGSIAYQQFVKHETPSLASQLLSDGYNTVAMHPYNASGWERDKVYPWFGFNEMYFLPDFEEPEKIRDYVSDSSMYKKIIDVYEENLSTDKPLFMFGVTMQNHGGYTGQYDNFDINVHVDGTAFNSQIAQYLSLVRISDFAFGELIDYFKKTDDKTVLVMFGDHQPGDTVVSNIYTRNGKAFPSEDLKEQQDRYLVPFFIWANYDIEEKSDLTMSVNYLAPLLCETAGIDLTAQQKYLTALREKYPVVTANCYAGTDGVFHPVDEVTQVPGLVDYQKLQYNLIFDWNDRAEGVFD